MEQQTQSPKLLRQRKFLIVLPILVLPFLTFLFWSLGGGKMEVANAVSTPTGLNINLPDVNLKDDRPQSKMDYYNQAQLDSTKFRELIKNDPHYNALAFRDMEEDQQLDGDSDDHSAENKGINSSIYGRRENNDPNEERVYRKLEQLNRELYRIDEPSPDHFPNAPLSSNPSNTSVNSADIDRLEQMMHTMSQPNGEDEEITQLNTMLEKILDIQHPGRVQEKLKQTSVERKGQVFAVAASDHSVPVSSLAASLESKSSNGFYSLDDPTLQTDSQNAVQAVIHETQTLVNGSTVKLRLIDDVNINGMLIPKNQFLFGTASLNGERLTIKISSIRYQNSLFPVELSVYDIDGQNGIYIPGAIGRDVAKESADRSMQTIGLASLDPSLSAQATSAGIEAAKTLFSRKVKLVKVTIKAGYQVLLRDEKQK